MIPSSQENASAFNATMLKFGAPQTIIRRYHHWSILLRPQQLTLGSLILAAHEPARAFSQLSPESFTELHVVTSQLEAALAKAFHYDKLNYLMLMMIDPDVHFHVLPRYSETRNFDGTEFFDSGWPGAPDLTRQYTVNPEINGHIIEHIASCWPEQ
jgi:diadenosine tetraphosphate (Ap4A) HIT family hydrolase